MPANNEQPANPKDAVPTHTRRKELVSEALSHVEGTEELPVAEQLSRLNEAHALLAAVLNDAPVQQLGIPGVQEEQ